jgi:hypothetical protein
MGTEATEGGWGLAGRVGSRNRGIKPLFSSKAHVSSSLRQVMLKKYCFCEWGYGGWVRRDGWEVERGKHGKWALQEGQTSIHHENDDNESCRMSEYTTRIY